MDDVTLGRAVDVYLRNIRNPNTLKTKKRDLIPFSEYIGVRKPLSKISTFMIEEFTADMIYGDAVNGGKPYAQNTIRVKLKTINIFFNHCVKRKLIDVNPMDGVHIPPEQVRDTRDGAFTREERESLILYAAGKTVHTGERLRDLAMFLFCSDCGPRASSLALMQRKHVDLIYNEATLINTKRGGTTYKVQFGWYCATVLRRWFVVLPNDPDAYLWNSRQPGEPVIPHSISQAVSRATEVIGIRKLSVHAFRHALGHTMMDDVGNINYVAKALNNTPEVAQKYYAPNDSEGAMQAMRRLSFRDPDGEENIMQFPQSS